MANVEFPRGRLPMHGIGAINTEVGRAEAAAAKERSNTPQALADILVNRALLYTPIGEGVSISVVEPKGPYTDEALLLFVYSNDFEKLSKQTESLYNLPENAQKIYWEVVLAALSTKRERLNGDPGKMLLYVENSISTTTSKDHRTSRTLNPHHGHLIVVDRALVVQDEKPIPHLEAERALFRRPRQKFVKRLAENLTGFYPTPMLRVQPPYGYEFEIQASEKDEIQEIMAVHHEAFSEVVERYLATARKTPLKSRLNEVIPQPSYRTYIVPVEGGLKVLISPEVISHAGVMESAGIQLDRNEKHPKRIDEKTLHQNHMEIVSRIRTQLEANFTA